MKMKHRIFILIFLLLHGAILNIAVAWGCATLSEAGIGVEARTPSVAERQVWAGRAPSGWLFSPDAVLVNRGFGIVEMEIANPPGALSFPPPQRGVRAGYVATLFGLPSPGTGHDRVLVIEAGWPMAALRGECWIGSPQPQTPGNIGIHCVRAILIHQPPDARIVPLHIKLPGFAVNTVFYAGMCWLLAAVPFAFRRLRGGRRIKRGLCPACAYPVGTSDVCTECGTPRPVTPKSVEPPP